MKHDFFGSPLSVGEVFTRVMNTANIQLPDGTIIKRSEFEAAQQPPEKSKTVLYVMIAAAVAMAGVLIFIIVKRK